MTVHLTLIPRTCSQSVCASAGACDPRGCCYAPWVRPLDCFARSRMCRWCALASQVCACVAGVRLCRWCALVSLVCACVAPPPEMLYPEFKAALALLPPVLLRLGRQQTEAADVALAAHRAECEVVKAVRGLRPASARALVRRVVVCGMSARECRVLRCCVAFAGPCLSSLDRDWEVKLFCRGLIRVVFVGVGGAVLRVCVGGGPGVGGGEGCPGRRRRRGRQQEGQSGPQEGRARRAGCVPECSHCRVTCVLFASGMPFVCAAHCLGRPSRAVCGWSVLRTRCRALRLHVCCRLPFPA
jgi:hypothetical protein